MKKLTCPSCGKQIIEQIPVEMPTSMEYDTPSIRVDRSDSKWGSNPASIFYKEGKYYLIFETTCCCPYCHTYFELDIPIELAEIEGTR